MKPIAGYEDYAVQRDGRVYSYKNESYRVQQLDKDGYKVVDLFSNGKRKNCKVHRLVAQAYIEIPEGATQVNHKDGDKTNNNVDNLEWCNQQHNNIHARDTGLNNSHGENHPLSKLSYEKAVTIRSLNKSGVSYSVLAEKYGVNFGTIGKIVRRERYTRI